MKKNHLLFSRLLSCILCAILAAVSVLALPGNSSAATLPVVDAYAYVIMDANNGEVLFEKNADARLYPASTAKMMTAIVALESDKSGQSFTATKKILSAVPSVASKAGAKAGTTYTFDDMLKMLLLPSGADGAYLLAYATYGSMTRFVAAMNEKAKQLGLNSTVYDNPVGLDISDGYDQLYGTARDYAVLTRYAMANKTIRDIVRLPKAKLSDGLILSNTNRFYTTYKDTTKGYTVIGTKTGSTNDAGICLCATARDEQGHEVICAYFKGASSQSTYTGIRSLLNYTFALQEKSYISLSLGAYDLRFDETEPILNHYLKEGIVKLGKTGAFYPEEPCTRKKLASLCTKACDQEIKFRAEKPDQEASILDFAKMVQKTELTFTTKQSIDIREKQEDKIKLTKKEAQALTTVYEAGLVPEWFGYNYRKILTRREMLILADRLDKAL